MITIKDILYEFNGKAMVISSEKAETILQQYQDLSGSRIDYNLYGGKPASVLRKYKYLNYGKESLNILFQLLDKYNYNKNYEIKDAIDRLNSPYTDRIDSDERDRYLHSPYIDDIMLDGSKLTIESEQLGRTEFIFADHYFGGNGDVTNYLRFGNTHNNCHLNVEVMSKIFPNLYSVTSICKFVFNDTIFYHSYCFDEDTNQVIDLCYNLVMDKDSYYKLFKCEEVFKIHGKYLKDAAYIARQYNPALSNFIGPIISTLFQQYIWENNLESPDKSIFSEEPSNKGLLMKNRFK